jgi:hypothetical protein
MFPILDSSPSNEHQTGAPKQRNNMSFKQISGVFGANLGEMAQLQGVVTSTMNQINSDLAKIETKITNTTWTGPDSTKGYDYWTQQKNI